MNHLKSYNESLRDKMTAVSEEDIKRKMGEEKYHIYKSIRDAKESIKPPFEMTQFTSGSEDDRNPNLFGVHIWYIRFLISYDGKKWTYSYDYNGSHDDMYFNSWDGVYNQMVLDTNKSFNREISQHTKEVNRHQETIDEIKKELEKVNKSA